MVPTYYRPERPRTMSRIMLERQAALCTQQLALALEDGKTYDIDYWREALVATQEKLAHLPQHA